MHFNFFGGAQKFVVLKDSPIELNLSTKYARERVEAHADNLFTPNKNGHKSYSGFCYEGTLVLPSGTELELLGYTMPFYESAFSVKVKLSFGNTGTKLGTFYVYTNIQSLEKIELEPCK